MKLVPLAKKDTQPHADYGFFGPDSVTWKVWSYPTSLTVGFVRAVSIEELDPDLVASVEQSGAVRKRTRTRYDRTLRYFAMVAFADSKSTAHAADILVKVHSKGIGIEPLSGQRYDANAPHSQLWIHLTAWHSILYAYERYGPGRLSEAEENQYWEECALAAELQTCSPDDVPRTREGIREYFETMRPQLVGSPYAQSMMDFLLDATGVVLRAGPLGPVSSLSNFMMRRAVIATFPGWMREMAGTKQPKAVDVAIRPVMKLAFRSMRLSTHGQLWLLKQLSPSTVPVVAPILFGIKPLSETTTTPSQAQETYGYDKPAEAHLDLRARQADRVFTHSEKASDEGIVESEPILGATAIA
ncbi:oxygenase MpaB family protein [Luteipulveratus mongoliensis]|uniref:ER-bound oxygenase mpaB/mpaB'/Rubber oxygenase catalytic domain-containing protein n=1 Tax=Luteipulveratus mongoliensis TaxID=571913 RepID=A0A0K1JF71_9MICO|nr:oxygenase MpaB family protein [Luteipulveratus mongoliensis]AKU15372.1 hypothetical protein VV02_04985 [Luteipulveratus mongoliensis]